MKLEGKLMRNTKNLLVKESFSTHNYQSGTTKFYRHEFTNLFFKHYISM